MVYGVIVGLCKSIQLILKVKTGSSEGISEQRKVIKLLIIIQRWLLLRLQRRKLCVHHVVSKLLTGFEYTEVVF